MPKNLEEIFQKLVATLLYFCYFFSNDSQILHDHNFIAANHYILHNVKNIYLISKKNYIKFCILVYIKLKLLIKKI